MFCSTVYIKFVLFSEIRKKIRRAQTLDNNINKFFKYLLFSCLVVMFSLKFKVWNPESSWKAAKCFSKVDCVKKKIYSISRCIDQAADATNIKGMCFVSSFDQIKRWKSYAWMKKIYVVVYYFFCSFYAFDTSWSL